MDRQRVLILYDQNLLGEGIQKLLSSEPAVNVIGLEPLVTPCLEQIAQLRPDVVIVAEAEDSPLVGEIRQNYAELALICVSYEKDSVQIYHCHQVPARAAELKKALYHLRPDESSAHSSI